VAVVTSCTRPLALARLRAARLPVPDLMVTSERTARVKPDPDPYLLGARELGVAPADCVVLEDAPAGVAAGRAAGMRVVAVRCSHDDHALRGADELVDDVATFLRGAGLLA
jgi:sugar-phosphatase